MRRRSDQSGSNDFTREMLIGLGESSVRKMYYPELQQKMADLERFRLLLDEAPDSIFLIDAKTGAIVDANGVARACCGALAGHDFQQSITDRLHMEMQWQQLGGGTADAENTKFKARLCCRGKQSIPVEVSARRVVIQEGEFLVLVARDITERLVAEEALSAAREKFYKAFRYASDVVGIVELDTYRYVELNDAAYRMFGYEPQEIIGHTSDEIQLWCIPGQREDVYRQLKNNGAVRNQEVVWRSKFGETRTGLLSVEPIDISGNRHIVFVWHDITERKRAEDELRQAQAQLEDRVEMRTQELTAANQELQATNEELEVALKKLTQMQQQLVESEKLAALGDLVAGVAHEINTPVGIGITAASHLEEVTRRFQAQYYGGKLKRQELDNFVVAVAENAQLLYSNLLRAAELIRSFKQVSVDQSTENRRVFNVYAYVEQVIQSLQPKLRLTQHQVTIECPERLAINSFPGAFAQVITVLLMNSLAHAYDPGEQGRITIAITYECGELCLVYSDDGKGIPPDVVNKIFEPFFTTARGEGATGLGLHILFNLVKQKFGGSVECHSKVREHTTFTIRFPAPLAVLPAE